MSNASQLMPCMPGFVAPSKPGWARAHWATPDDVIRSWEEYSAACEAKRIPVGSKKTPRTIPTPTTITGFAAHCGISRQTFYNYCNRDTDVGRTVEQVRLRIEENLVVGGLTRQLDSSLTARVAQLADRLETTNHTTVESSGLAIGLSQEFLDTLTDAELEAAMTIVRLYEHFREHGAPEPNETRKSELNKEGRYYDQNN